MKSKKLFLMIGVMFLVLLILGSMVSATRRKQEKILTRKCLYSFNDSDFGAWDDANQKGVFLEVVNDNLNIGDNEDEAYRYINHQDPREYYNNFHHPDGSTFSEIPMLQIEQGKQNRVYINCSFKDDDHRLFVNLYLIASTLHNFGNFLTSDFDLTTGIVGNVNTNYFGYLGGDFQDNPYSLEGESVWNGILLDRFSDEHNVYGVANGIDGYCDGTAGCNVYDYLVTKGFYGDSNLHPYVLSFMDIEDTAKPGFYYTGPYIRANNDMLYWTDTYGHYTLFYINSSNTIDSSSVYIPNRWDLVAVNIDNNNEQMDENSIYERGDDIEFTLTIHNDYSQDIFSIDLECFPYAWHGMSNINTNGINGFSMTHQGTKHTEQLNILAQSSQDVVFTFPLLEAGDYSKIPPYVLCEMRRNNVLLKHKWMGFGHLGFTDEAYLFPGVIDPRIVLDGGDPHFQIKVNLKNKGAKTIPANDYKLKVEIFNAGNIVDTVYKDIDVAVPSPGLPYTEYDEAGVAFVALIKMDTTKYKLGEQYYARVSTQKIAGEPSQLIGKEIARSEVDVIFKAGDIQTTEDVYFYFGPDRDKHIKDITLFNPDFETHTITLFDSGWTDTKNFDITYPNIITLGPLKSKKVEVEVTAKHDPWPTNPETQYFNLTAKSDQNGQNGAETIIKYTLSVSNLAVGSCNHNGNVIGINQCYYNGDDFKLYKCKKDLSKLPILEPASCTDCTCPPIVPIPDNKAHCGCSALGTNEQCKDFKFSIGSECNKIHINIDTTKPNFWCAWECDGPFCPPEDRTIGDCIGCKDNIKTCGDYNNDVTCNADPCYKADDSCDLIIDKLCSTDAECEWDNAENECNVKGKNDVGIECTVKIKITKECKAGITQGEIEASGCGETHTTKFPCPAAELPFFTAIHFLIGSLIVTVIYVFSCKKKL